MGHNRQVTHPYLHYDVFTSTPLAGNQLAVIPDATGLDAAKMQLLAREMAFSETTFVFPAEDPATDVRMRIFTPYNELPMAGHPTIGTTFALAHTGVITPLASRVVFGLNVGPTPVDLEWHDTPPGVRPQLKFAWMTQRNPEFGRTFENREQVARTLRLEEGDLGGTPVQEVSSGTPFVFVPVKTRAAVDRAETDATAMRAFEAIEGEVHGMFLFSVEQGDPPASVYSRMFAPQMGIAEDPATGGASGPLGAYLVRYGLVAKEQAGTLLSLQGVKMGRPSHVHIRVAMDGAAITGVQVGGESVLIATGTLLV